MIAGRMLEAFSPACERDTGHRGHGGRADVPVPHSVSVVKPGLESRIQPFRKTRRTTKRRKTKGMARFDGSETVPVSGHSLAKEKTMPSRSTRKPPLLAAMESCGKGVGGRGARGDEGTGHRHPATRAAVIATLFKREYVERSGKALVPTDKGMAVYEAVKKMRVADVELTGSWEKTLMQIERHKLAPKPSCAPSASMPARSPKRYFFPSVSPRNGKRRHRMPQVRKGKIILRQKLPNATTRGCGLLVFRRFLNKELTDQHLAQLFSSGTTKLIKGFEGQERDGVRRCPNIRQGV